MIPENYINEMEQSVLDCLSDLDKGYAKLKWAIAKETGIPVDILTPILKRLKYEGKIELMMIWSEETCRPDGSGYCLTAKNKIDE